MTDITKEQLDEFKEKAMNAAPDSWVTRSHTGKADGQPVKVHGGLTEDGRSIHPRISIEECITPGGSFIHHRTAEYIATFDPDTVKSLLHWIDRQHEALKATLNAVNDGHVDASEDFILELGFLVKSLEAPLEAPDEA